MRQQPNKDVLLRKLDQLEGVIQGSKFRRLFYTPPRYLSGIFLSKVLYPATGRGTKQKVKTYFDVPMLVNLPAAMDIFLLGTKTHDSEIRLQRFLIKSLKEGAHFVDVGAHYGFYSLLASQLVGSTGKVHAFEASRDTFNILRYNTREQPCIAIYNRAVSEEHGSTAQFFEFPTLQSEYNTLFGEQFRGQSWSGKGKRYEVATVALDYFFTEKGIQPDIIKVDVEGAELLVLKGMAETLSRNNPIVVMEYVDDRESTDSYEQALVFLTEKNYELHVISASGVLKPAIRINKYLKEKKIRSENLVFTKRARI